MSYRITINGEPFCSSEFEHSAVLDPKVTLEVNKAGSLIFTILPDHPYYNSIEFRQSIFDVYLDNELIWEGIPVSEATDFWNRKVVTCEGELTFLNDTIQRQAVYQNQTVQSLLGEYLTVHNAQADATKQFTVGSVTVSGGNSIYRYTNYQSTMTELQEDLIQNFGGYFRIRHSGGVRYLDYLSSSPHNSSQTVRVGKNLVDLSQNLSSLDICTVLIPLGAKTGNQVIDGLDERLDIKSVNSNLDYLVGTAQAYYGNVWKTQIWDDVTTASALKQKGQDYLNDAQWANLVIEATAFDLGLATEDVEQFHVLDMIRVVSEPHGIDRYFMLTKLEIDLDHPANTQITLGQDTRLSLSARTAKNTTEIERQETTIMVNASENARQILDSATDGAIQILYNQDGVAYELRINNSQDPSTATKWWRYNSGGWGFTADGGATYTTAATNDGTIFATLIKAGILRSDNGKFYVNLDTGAASFSDVNITGGEINIANCFIVDEFGDVQILGSASKISIKTNPTPTTESEMSIDSDDVIISNGTSTDKKIVAMNLNGVRVYKYNEQTQTEMTLAELWHQLTSNPYLRLYAYGSGINGRLSEMNGGSPFFKVQNVNGNVIHEIVETSTHAGRIDVNRSDGNYGAIIGAGQITLYNGTNTGRAVDLSISSNTGRLTLYDLNGTERVKITTSALEYRDSSGNLRINLDFSTGLRFYDSYGNPTKTYGPNGIS